MPLHYTRNGYTFTADAHSLTITPGPEPITLERTELERLGLERLIFDSTLYLIRE